MQASKASPLVEAVADRLVLEGKLQAVHRDGFVQELEVALVRQVRGLARRMAMHATAEAAFAGGRR